VAGYSGTGPAPPRAQQDVRAPPSYWPSLDFSPFFLYLSVRLRGIHGVKGPSAAVVGFEREREKGERESDGPQSCCCWGLRPGMDCLLVCVNV
jgi:hypothetical protein